uniref:Uncharacterized protein n=1 Tax=mine drainage metagenome TaxID=410659 RepID=E6QSA6_9ZZZZ
MRPHYNPDTCEWCVGEMYVAVMKKWLFASGGWTGQFLWLNEGDSRKVTQVEYWLWT